jgi:hypothetical protein
VAGRARSALGWCNGSMDQVARAHTKFDLDRHHGPFGIASIAVFRLIAACPGLSHASLFPGVWLHLDRRADDHPPFRAI